LAGGGGRDRKGFCFHAEAGKHQDFDMSQHRSLRAIATVGGKRNVLKRFERVGLLKKRGQWKEGDRITGLRKTKPDA
jgi:small basic protein (TIGR04137 family)